ncbi:MAG: TetR/AcrR family transcriptional regulator [Cellvibrionaceae bacterium]
MSDTRNLLIDTMKTLLWERGYDATSPNQVLEASGVGKGSLYHHFKSKKELAVAAMNLRADELIEEAETIFTADDHWLHKFETYLFLPREGLAGCRLGRITQDPSIKEDKELQRPIKRYFKRMRQLMEQVLVDAQSKGHISSAVNIEQLSLVIIGAVQGGFVVSRANHDASMLNSTVQGIYAILQSLSLE